MMRSRKTTPRSSVSIATAFEQSSPLLLLHDVAAMFTYDHAFSLMLIVAAVTTTAATLEQAHSGFPGYGLDARLGERHCWFGAIQRIPLGGLSMHVWLL